MYGINIAIDEILGFGKLKSEEFDKIDPITGEILYSTVSEFNFTNQSSLSVGYSIKF